MTLDLHDIQGNILSGYRTDVARHFVLGIGNAAGGARFIGALVSGTEGATEGAAPQVTTAATWNARPSYCLNIGVTFEHGDNGEKGHLKGRAIRYTR